MKKNLGIFLISGLLAISLIGQPLGTPEINLIDKSNKSVIISYDLHAPINIITDQDFEDQLWPGEGSVEQPYIIENLNITGSGNSINIENTRMHFIIRDCVLSSSMQDGTGVRIVNVTNAVAEFCTIHTRQNGVVLDRTSNTVIRNNTISNCNQDGITLIDSDSNQIGNNTIFEISNQGIYLFQSPDNILEYNDINDVGGNGILIQGSSDQCQVRYNSITYVGANGISLESSNCGATSNTVELSTWAGIVAYQAPNSVIANNEITFTGEYGIWVAYSSYSSVLANILDSTGGITVEEESDHTEVTANAIYYTFWTGIRIFSCDYCTIGINNILNGYEDGILVHGSSRGTSVIANTVQGTDWQGISFDNAPNARVESNVITDISENGILCINGSSNALFTNNDIQETEEFGINAMEVDNITITENTISMIDESGIRVEDSDTVTIYSNTITECGLAGIELIVCSSGATIVSNLIDQMGTYGITMLTTPSSFIVGNFVRFSGSYLIRMSSSENSEIYHNGFVESLDIYGRITSSINCEWSNGTHGNYWGNYNGVDENADGVGDTPYTIDTDQIDPHPLTDFRFIGAYERIGESDLVLTLSHAPPNPLPSEDITLILQVDEPIRVSNVIFRYSLDDGVTWIIPATNENSDSWNSTIPGQPAGTRIMYAANVIDMGGDTINSNILFIDIGGSSSLSGFNIVTLVILALSSIIVIVVVKTGYELKKKRSLNRWADRF